MLLYCSGGSKGGVTGVRTPPEIPGKKFLHMEDDQNRDEDTKISKNFLGDNPPKQ